MKRQRIKHTVSFAERLATEARRLKDEAKALPPGKDREMLLRRARQTETASHINAWLSLPGLASTK